MYGQTLWEPSSMLFIFFFFEIKKNHFFYHYTKYKFICTVVAYKYNIFVVVIFVCGELVLIYFFFFFYSNCRCYFNSYPFDMCIHMSGIFLWIFTWFFALTKMADSDCKGVVKGEFSPCIVGNKRVLGNLLKGSFRLAVHQETEAPPR